MAALSLAVVSAPTFSGEDPVVTPQAGLAETLEAQRDAIMALPGVVGTGLSRCDDQPCITVLAHQPSPELERKLELLLGGHRFTVVQTGPIHAYPEGR